MGAWIEIDHWRCILWQRLVAPFMGAWIEICPCGDGVYRTARRTLHGCVD